METEQSTLIGISHGDPCKAVWVRPSLTDEEVGELKGQGVSEVDDVVTLDNFDPASLMLIHSEATSAGNLDRAAKIAVQVKDLLAQLRDHEVEFDQTALSVVTARQD